MPVDPRTGLIVPAPSKPVTDDDIFAHKVFVLAGVINANVGRMETDQRVIIAALERVLAVTVVDQAGPLPTARGLVIERAAKRFKAALDSAWAMWDKATGHANDGAQP